MMKALVVCSYKEHQKTPIAPFVREQVDALRNNGVECECYLVKGRGVLGYLKQLKPLKNKISEFHPDVIHAHFGLCGLLANLQRRIPVVTTYHGSDINDRKVRPFSRMAMRLSKWNVFVSRKTLEIIRPKRKYTLLPCGIDFSDLQLTEKADARRRMCLDENKKYVLFAGAFDNAVKDAPLAKAAVELLNCSIVQLLELKDYSREEVTLLMCASDVFLMTSLSEGSPQVIKETMACGCPIVSVDVGDVKERVDGVAGCYIAKTREPKELAKLLQKALAFDGKTNGRKIIIADGLANRRVVENLVEIYRNIIRIS